MTPKKAEREFMKGMNKIYNPHKKTKNRKGWKCYNCGKGTSNKLQCSHCGSYRTYLI